MEAENQDFENQITALKNQANGKNCEKNILNKYTGTAECESIQDQIDDLKQKIDDNEQRIDDIEEQIDDLENQNEDNTDLTQDLENQRNRQV